MALKIRLSRGGSKKRPYYHIVVADARSPRDGRFLERVGAWDPMLPKDGQRVKLDEERMQYWLGQGALPTDRVSRFLEAVGLRKSQVRNNPHKGEPRKKAKERMAAAEQTAEEGRPSEEEALPSAEEAQLSEEEAQPAVE